MTKVAIIIYTLYHHIGKMAEAVKAGVESSGVEADIFQVPETLPENILKILHAPKRPDYPIATTKTLTSYDGFMFGVPTRFGNMPTQIKSFIDGTGGLWANGSLYQKPCGVFVSTNTGGGRELTALSMVSTFAHHGMLYVPLGFAKCFQELSQLDEPQGGSAWGAGCLASADGSRDPSPLELKIAKVQGTEFAKVAAKMSAK